MVAKRRRGGDLKLRIARVKLTPFVDALEATFPTLDLPGQFPAPLLRCLLPDHEDRTPSFSLQPERWHCFGCGRGGDVLDFAQAYYEISLTASVELVESALGLGRAADLKSLAALAARRIEDARRERGGDLWAGSVRRIEEEYTRLVRPYLTCADWLVQDLAWPSALYVYEELSFAASEPPPRTARASRERARDLRKWALDHARGTIRFVEHATGKDVIDVVAQRQRAR